MKKINNKSGFTLIEIIVVLIIIGILVAIAIPNLFSNVPRANAAAALATVDGYKTTLEACYGTNPNTTGGGAVCTFALLGLQTALQNNFTLTLAGGGNVANSNLTYNITASDGTNIAFVLTRTSNGFFSCSPGSNAYSTVCQ